MKTQNCSTLLVLALCASLAPAAVAQVSGAAPATIFEHIGFGGGSQDMIVGMNVGPLALGNDVASSVKVSKCFKVTLYGAGPGQNGPELVLTADDDNLMDNDFNDILSNVLVERVPNCVASANVASEDVAAAVITPERQEAREAATTLLPSGSYAWQPFGTTITMGEDGSFVEVGPGIDHRGFFIKNGDELCFDIRNGNCYDVSSPDGNGAYTLTAVAKRMQSDSENPEAGKRTTMTPKN